MESATQPLSSKMKALDAFAMLDVAPPEKDLINETFKVMRSLGHVALDPVHIIAGAYWDVSAPRIVEIMLHQKGIVDYQSAREAAKSAPQVPHGVGGDQSENTVVYFTEFAYAMLAELYDLHQSFREGHYQPPAEFDFTWNWYAETVKLALRSQSPAVLTLLSE